MKKCFSGILCFLLALAVFAGCADSGSSTTPADSATAQSSGEGVQAAIDGSVSEALNQLAYQLSQDGDSTDPPPETMASQQYTIGVVLPHLANPHFIAEAYGFISEGERLGVEVIVNEAGGYTNLSTQIQQFEDFIANKVDALVIVAVDAEGTVGVVDQANSIGIPVINVNVMTASEDVVTKIRSDDTTIGEMQAQFVGEKLGGQGKILMLCGPAGSSWAMDRSAGYENYMNEHYPDIEIVDKRFLDSEPTAGLSEMEDALQVYPDLAAVFTGSDNLGLGAAQAIKAAGLDGKVVITTTDTQDACLEYVREGVITATICQSSAIMGEWGTRAAVAVLEGKAPELVKRYWTPLNMITQENVDTFEFEGISRPPEGWTVGGH